VRSLQTVAARPYRKITVRALVAVLIPAYSIRMEVAMNRPSAIGLLIAVLLVVSGYVSSSPKEAAQTTRAASTERHPDAHVSYYKEHLIAIGIMRRDP
jgi:hypothetical protein